MPIARQKCAGRPMPQSEFPRSPCDATKLELELVLNAVNEGLCGLDGGGQITFCNDAFLRMTGYGTEEINGMNLRELLGRGRPQGLKYGMEDLDRRPITAPLPIHIVGDVCWRRDGTPFPTEFWMHPLARPLCSTEWLATIHDISERKQAEEKLLFEAALLEAQSETTLDGILVVDADNKVVRTNKQFVVMFEVPSEVLTSREDSILLRHVTERVANPEAFIARVKYLYSHPEEKSHDELSFKNGRTYDRYSSPLIDSKGRNRGRIWYFRDITKRRAAERELRLVQFSLLHASDDVRWVNSQGRVVYANDAACRSLGRSREEILAWSIPDIDPRVTAESWPGVWEMIKARGSITFETEHKTKQGHVFPAEVTANYVEFDGQEYAFALARDITQRKQAEKELRLAQFSLEHASDSVFWIDSGSHIVYVNQAACRSLGRSREELLSLSISDIDPIFPKDGWGAFWKDLKTKLSTSFETQHQTKLGRKFPVEITATYLEFDGKEYSFARCATSPSGSRRRRRCEPRKSAIDSCLSATWREFFALRWRDAFWSVIRPPRTCLAMTSPRRLRASQPWISIIRCLTGERFSKS